MQKFRVLLVDDYMPIRAALRRLLAHYHHDVLIVGEASDGQQAIERMASCQPDVILMDIIIPDDERHRSYRSHQKVVEEGNNYWTVCD